MSLEMIVSLLGIIQRIRYLLEKYKQLHTWLKKKNDGSKKYHSKNKAKDLKAMKAEEEAKALAEAEKEKKRKEIEKLNESVHLGLTEFEEDRFGTGESGVSRKSKRSNTNYKNLKKKDKKGKKKKGNKIDLAALKNKGKHKKKDINVKLKKKSRKVSISSKLDGDLGASKASLGGDSVKTDKRKKKNKKSKK